MSMKRYPNRSFVGRAATVAGVGLAMASAPLFAQTGPLPTPRPGSADPGKPQPPPPAIGPLQEMPKPNPNDLDLPKSGSTTPTATNPTCTIAPARNTGYSGDNYYITSRHCVDQGKSKKKCGG